MELNLHETEWDCCVLGNGVAALWIAHWLWSSKKSVLWITSEEPYSPERAMLQHGWLWDVDAEHAALLTNQITGFDSRVEAPDTDAADAAAPAELPPFEAIYYDARSPRRFKKLNEAKAEWGAHEKSFFEALIKSGANTEKPFVDMWEWHSKLHAFHNTGQAQGPTKVELFNDPRFVRVQGWPLVELKTTSGRISGITLSGLKPTESIEIKASKFYLGDFDENLPALLTTQSEKDVLAGAIKGKAYAAGFGLRLWHKELESVPSQLTVVPLVVSPEKNAGSHLVGRFHHTRQGLESLWVGFLTEDELEDNNEILKKIKQARRAVDRAVPGFADSITREAVTFEPRMSAHDLVKTRKLEALGAILFSDHYGPRVAAETLGRIFNGTTGEVKKKERVVKAAPGRIINPTAGHPETEHPVGA